MNKLRGNSTKNYKIDNLQLYENWLTKKNPLVRKKVKIKPKTRGIKEGKKVVSIQNNG